MDRIPESGVLWIAFITLVIFVIIPAGFIFLIFWIPIWIYRKANKNKKAQPQGTGDNDQVRCLDCGAVIDPNQQSCQKCGWTWK
jgi:hypothetical protein